MATVTIQLPHHGYEVRIEPGSLEGLGESVRDLAPHGQCGLVADPAVHALYGEAAEKSLAAAGYATVSAKVGAGETAKTMATVEEIHRVLLDSHLERRSPIIALGGGITGDVATWPYTLRSGDKSMLNYKRRSSKGNAAQNK